MALVNIIDVQVLDNPTAFTNPFQFEITFECIQELQDDLEWKVVYVGNAEDQSGDQVLEEVMVGPVVTGINRFVLQTEAPDPRVISNEDLIGVTVILITCSYMENKFVQIGYYVNNEYAEPYEPESYPNPVIIGKLNRNILAGEPRVTRFAIDWTGGNVPLSQSGATEGEGGGGEGGIEQDDDGDIVDFNKLEEDGEGDEEGEGDDEDEGDVDLANQQDEDDNEEIDIEEDGEDGSDPEQQFGGVEVANEDSMDVERMLQS
jgi:histone chaperone ASF1